MGVDFYNYVVENSIGGDMWSDPSYSFKSDENVYFSAFGITERISQFGLRENIIVTTLTQFGGSNLTLDYTGNVAVNWL